ncbi:MAG: hypothetical protein K1X85_03770 [Ignavibacteria bacterium]|nr:hypothetical protein [Ignavibacteria bacterium]
MRDSKLIALLKSFSPAEFRDFEKFVSSPYFSKGRDLVPFFKALKPFYPDFENEILNAENVFRKLFPGREYDKVKSANIIKTLSSQMFMACKNFLTQLGLQEDEFRKQFYLINELRKRKLYTEFEKDHKSIGRTADDPFKGTVRDFVDRYFTELLARDYSLDKDDFRNSYEANLKSAEYSLLAGLINTFKHQDEKNIARAYNLQVRDNLLDAMLDNLDADGLIARLRETSHPMNDYLEIYFLIYRMNKAPYDTSLFYKARNLLQERRELFGQTENYTLWNTLLSFCNIANLPSDEHFYIFNHILDNGIYRKSDSEDFHIVLFRNIVLVASAMKKTEWLENFLGKYSDEIHADHRTDMRLYSYAALNFLKGEYSAALGLIQKIRFELFLYKPDMRVLQLKIFYKLGYTDQLFSMIDSTIHYLRNTKEIRDDFKESVKNLTKYLKEFIKMNEGRTSRKDIDLLKKRVKEEPYLGQRNWLLEEADLLEGK